MIRAHRVSATAQDDASLISGWNISPNVSYTLRLTPSAGSCGVFLYDESNVLVASGAVLSGTEQPCILVPQTGQSIGMVYADLGWHVLISTDGTESQRTIRITPAVDLPDEIHPVYGDDGMGLARATAAIDAAAHYIDDVTVTCPLCLGAGLGDIVSVPVDGVAVVGQVESITWTATPDGAIEQVVIRRHVAIAPDVFVEPTPVVPPVVANDVGSTDAATATAGNVLANDESGLTVVAVNALSASVGQAVAGSNGGTFTIASTGAWTFDPAGDFALLSGPETATTSVIYYASDGVSEAVASLTITVSAAVSQQSGPELIGSATSAWHGTANRTITLPPGIQPGDIVIVAHQSSWHSPATMTVVSAGYTQVALIRRTGNPYSVNMHVCYKIMGSTPDASVVLKTNADSSWGNTAIVQVWRGVDQAAPLDVTPVHATGGSGTIVSTGQVTPITTNAMMLAICGIAAEPRPELAPPVGYENTVQIRDANASASCISSKEWASGVEGPLNWNNYAVPANCTWASALLALRPA